MAKTATHPRTRNARAPKTPTQADARARIHVPTASAPGSARARMPIVLVDELHAHTEPDNQYGCHCEDCQTRRLMNDLDRAHTNVLGRRRDETTMQRLQQLSSMRRSVQTPIHPDALILRVCDTLTRISEALERIEERLDDIGGRL